MRKNGFTMVEVIIVVAIIAILASIIVPKMSGGRDKANFEACKTNLRHIGMALEMYNNDNGQYSPSSAGTSMAMNNSCYLVQGGYLKNAVYCPLGNYAYRLFVNYTGSWCAGFGVPSGSPLVTCDSYVLTGGTSESGHPGYAIQTPAYWPSRGVFCQKL